MRSKAYWGYTPEFIESCRAELTVEPGQMTSEEFDYVVAEAGESIVGYYAIEAISESSFELEALFVDPDHVRRGIGGTMIRHAIENISQKGGVTLLIQSDPDASGFYLSFGAQRIGTRESGSIPGRSLPLFQILVRSFGENTA